MGIEKAIWRDRVQGYIYIYIYKSLLGEEGEKKVPIYGTYHQEIIYVDVEEFINNEPIVCNALTKNNAKSLRALRSNEEWHYSLI